MQISEETMSRLRETAEPWLKRYAAGENPMEIQSDIYCLLPDKSKETGDMMAAHNVELVNEYEANKARALENQDAWIGERIDALVDEKPYDERCGILWRALAGFRAWNDRDHASEILDGADNFDASAVSEEELRQKLAEAMKRSPFGQEQVRAMLETLENSIGDEAQAVVDFGRSDRDIKAILSMLTYVNAKSGLFLEIPMDATMEIITPSVCMACDVRRVAAEVEMGETTVEEASSIIQILGCIVGVMATISFSGAYIAASAALIAAMPPVLAVFSVPFFLISLMAMMDAFCGAASEFATQALDLGWKVARGGIKLIVLGLRALWEFFVGTIIPAAQAVWNSLTSWIMGTEEETRRLAAPVVQTEPVPAE